MENKNPILSGELLLSSKFPMHYQLMMIIKRGIASKNIKPGDKLPTEEELCRAYGVSRSTVRSALKALEDDSLIQRVRGRGTFISSPKMRRVSEQIYSFSHEMESAGMKPSSNVLEFEKLKVSPDLAQIFDLGENEKVFRFVRVRIADSVPLLLETTFMPVKIYPGLTAAMLRANSYYDILFGKVGIMPYHAEETYESVVLEKSIVDVLECAPYKSGFYVERVTKKEDGAVYEFTQSFMRGDRSKIVVTLQHNFYTFSRNIE